MWRSFFSIEKKRNEYIGVFEDNGYAQYLDVAKQNLIKKLNKKKLDDETINEWIKLLDVLKEAVKKYMYKHKVWKNERSSKEKITQQELAQAFNNNDVKYFNYDMEYNIKAFNNYVFYTDTQKPVTNEKGKKVTQTLGRIDNILIEFIDDKVYIKLMEVKEGGNAIKLITKSTKIYGNGMIGHVNFYMQIIDCVKKDIEYESKYLQDRNVKNYKFKIREILMDDIKNIMNFYKRFDLINNSNFKNRDYDNLKFGDIELVFYFGGYNFEMEDNEILKDNLNVITDLINRDYPDMKYDYINSEQIYDFKYYKDDEDYMKEKKGKKLDIENYNQVKVKKLNDNKIKLYE